MTSSDKGAELHPDRVRTPVRVSRLRETRTWVATTWRTLPPLGRVALAGVLASAMAAVVLGVTITSEIKRQLLDAEGRGLQAAVAAIEPAMTQLATTSPSPADLQRLDEVMNDAVLGPTHVRAKLWALDGTIIYSDAHQLIGRSFPEVRPRLAQAAEGGVNSEVTDLAELENEFEREYERLIEFYVPVRSESGSVDRVLEIYADVTFLEAALSRVSLVTWAAIGSGITILMLFLAILVSTMVRSISRDRATAEARAAELAILVDAMDAISSSLVPGELLRRLERSIRSRLGMTTLGIEATPPDGRDSIGVPLRDGTWLVATRREPPLTPEDARILRAVGDSLEAALDNAALYAEVSEAARQRRELLGRLADAHDEERHRIVGELHDSLAADLIRVLYGIRGIAARSATLPKEIATEITGLELLVQQTETQLRALMGRVQPVAISEGGFDDTLESLASRARMEAGLEVRVHDRAAGTGLSDDAQRALIRAVDEALMNVRKHAQAQRVLIRTSADASRFRLSIDDDGVGWGDRAALMDGRGLGLAYVEERVAAIGGSVIRTSSRLGGARLLMVVPLASHT